MPALIDGGRVLTQSLPIIEYLDEVCPIPPVLPAAPAERARVRALAQLVASDIHPLVTVRVIDYLDSKLLLPSEQQQDWLRHWILHGLRAFETLLAGHPETGLYCHGDAPTLADICLIPQMHTARRFACDLTNLPTIERICNQCLAHPAFSLAAPENQPDAPRC